MWKVRLATCYATDYTEMHPVWSYHKLPTLGRVDRLKTEIAAVLHLLLTLVGRLPSLGPRVELTCLPIGWRLNHDHGMICSVGRNLFLQLRATPFDLLRSTSWQKRGRLSTR
jgi:hypothetical protein